MVILACGNPSRGDDAIGPALMERLEDAMATHAVRGGIDRIVDYQFQVEHALELDGRALALFVDAAASGAAPYVLRRVVPRDDRSHTTHVLTPAGVLHVHARVGQGPAPAAYVLSVRGESFELGAPLSAAARANADAAFGMLGKLCADAREAAWDRVCGAPEKTTAPV